MGAMERELRSEIHELQQDTCSSGDVWPFRDYLSWRSKRKPRQNQEFYVSLCQVFRVPLLDPLPCFIIFIVSFSKTKLVMAKKGVRKFKPNMSICENMPKKAT